MPTTYAHYRLGDAVAKKLPDSARNTVIQHRELFDIGVHGPDIFFYHNPIVKNEVVSLGVKMHHEPGSAFFAKASLAVIENENKEAHKAYLYGFLCHFAMDVTCHGYIGERIRETGVGHYEIEAEFDRALLEQDGFEAVSKCLTGHLHPTRKNAAIISHFWKEISEKQVQQTLKRMVFFLNILCAPSPVKRNFLFLLLRMVGQYENMHGLVINYKENPASKETTQWLMNHFDEAVNLAVDLITEYEIFVENGGVLSEMFSYDFESEKKTPKGIHIYNVSK